MCNINFFSVPSISFPLLLLPFLPLLPPSSPSGGEGAYLPTCQSPCTGGNSTRHTVTMIRAMHGISQHWYFDWNTTGFFFFLIFILLSFFLFLILSFFSPPSPSPPFSPPLLKDTNSSYLESCF